MKKELFKMKKGLLLMVMAAMVLTFTACGNDEAKEEVVEVLEKEFIFNVVDAEGVETVFQISTTEDMVGAALMAEGLIEGTDGEWGLMVDTVNGVQLDWDTTGMYWAFYVDGEYSNTGVDVTEIVEGQTYAFIAE